MMNAKIKFLLTDSKNIISLDGFIFLPVFKDTASLHSRILPLEAGVSHYCLKRYQTQIRSVSDYSTDRC